MQRKRNKQDANNFGGFASSAFGAFSEIRNEIENIVKIKISAMLSEMDIVRRDEVDILRDMIASDRTRIKALENELDAINQKNESTVTKS